MTACATGCTRRGHHHADCPDVCRHRAQDRDCPPKCDAHCPGCQPRPAEYGNLCPWCWQRLHGDIVDTPALIRHLRQTSTTTTGPAGKAGTRAARRESERTIYPPAWSAADELHATLAALAHDVLEQHPHGRTWQGPDETGTTRSSSTLADYQGESYVRHSQVTGIAPPPARPTRWRWQTRTAPVLDSEGRRIEYLDRVHVPPPLLPDPAAPTVALVRWLLPHLAWCAEQPWIGEVRRYLAEVVATTKARWPTAERGRAIKGIPCPRCDLATLYYDPPDPDLYYPGALTRPPMVVRCTNPDCGRTYTEAEWDRMRKLIRLAHDHGTLQDLA